jgi:hypothetical protein
MKGFNRNALRADQDRRKQCELTCRHALSASLARFATALPERGQDPTLIRMIVVDRSKWQIAKSVIRTFSAHRTIERCSSMESLFQRSIVMHH